MNSLRNPVGWFEIYVRDMERARAFYEQVFQVTLTPLDSPAIRMLAFPGGPERPGCAGSLVQMPGKEPGNGTLVYFSCADCSVEAGRAVTAGGAICKPKFPIGQYGFVSLVTDPDGNMIGLHSMQ